VTAIPDIGFQGVAYERLSSGAIGPTIPAVSITFVSEDNLIKRTVTTNAYGSYRVNLVQGRYRVTAQHPNYNNYSSFPGFFVVTGTGYQTGNFFLKKVTNPPTAAANTVRIDEDSTYAFSAADFHFSDIDGDSLRSVKITTLQTAGTLELNNADVRLNQVISVGAIGAGKLTFTPAANANGDGYASFGFSVNDGSLDYTMTIDVTAVPAMGFRGFAYERLSSGAIGPTIPAVSITFVSENNLIKRTVTTNAYGSYRVNLGQGRYRVTAQHPDYNDYSSFPGFFVVTGTGYQTGNFFLKRR